MAEVATRSCRAGRGLMSYALSPCARFITFHGAQMTIIEGFEQADGHRQDAADLMARGKLRAAGTHLSQAAKLEGLARQGWAVAGARAS